MSFSYTSASRLRWRQQPTIGSISNQPNQQTNSVVPQETNPFGVTTKYFDMKRQFSRPAQQPSNNSLPQNTRATQEFSSSFPLKSQNYPNNMNTASTTNFANSQSLGNSNFLGTRINSNFNQFPNTVNDQNKFGNSFPTNSSQANKNNFSFNSSSFNTNKSSSPFVQNNSNNSSNNFNTSFQNTMNSSTINNNNSNPFYNNTNTNIDKTNTNNSNFNVSKNLFGNNNNSQNSFASNNSSNNGFIQNLNQSQININTNANGNTHVNSNFQNNNSNGGNNFTAASSQQNNQIPQWLNSNSNSNNVPHNKNDTNNNQNLNQNLHNYSNYSNFNNSQPTPSLNQQNNQQYQQHNNQQFYIQNNQILNPQQQNNEQNNQQYSQQNNQQYNNQPNQFLVQALDFINSQYLPWIKSIQQSKQYLNNYNNNNNNYNNNNYNNYENNKYQNQQRETHQQRMNRKLQQFQQMQRINQTMSASFRKNRLNDQQNKIVIVVRQAPKISQEQRIRRAIAYQEKQKQRKDAQYMAQYGMTYDHYQLYIKWKQYDRYHEYAKKQQLQKKLPSDFPFHKIGIREIPKPVPLNYFVKKRQQKKLENLNTQNVQVSQFTEIVNMDYVIDFKWLEDPSSVPSAKISGRVQISARPSRKEVQQAVWLDVCKNMLKGENRKHSVIVASFYYKTYNPNIFMKLLGYKQKIYKDIDMKGTVTIPKINLPQGYSYNPKQFQGWSVKNLQIFNKYGKITWQGQTNIQSVDFSKNISIEDNAVQCQISVLKKQAVVQFYSIPNLRGYQRKEYVEKRLQKACKNGGKFLSLDFKKKSWKIGLDFSVEQKQKVQKELSIKNENSNETIMSHLQSTELKK